MAVNYINGISGKKDYNLAIKWLNRSIELGNNNDIIKLGYMYQNGFGVKLDYNKAMSLYNEALRLNVDGAQESINKLNKLISTKSVLYGKAYNRLINATFFDYLTALSFVLAFIFYSKSKRDKILKFDIRSYNLIKDSINKFDLLKIEYDGQKIDNLTISKVAVWNSGKEAVRKSDIPVMSPICVKSNDGIILNSSIIAQSNISNMFSCNISDNKDCVIIDFDFIDYDNAAIIEFLHTSSNLSVSGCVIGGKGISKSTFAKLAPVIRKKSIVGLIITTILFIIVDIAVISNFNDLTKSEPDLIVIFVIIIFTLTVLSALLFSGCLSLLRSKPMSGFDFDN